MSTLHTRRTFLTRGLTVLSAAATVPLFLQNTAFALNDPKDAPLSQKKAGTADEQILVVIQLSGGNDGLATVIPLDNDDYRKARPELAVTKDYLTLGKGNAVALCPSLKGFRDMFDAGTLAVIQGVGYPNPNRSHFRSMEIWHTADPSSPPRDGWLGRYFDAQCKGDDPKDRPDPKAAINLGSVAPLAMHGSKFSAISFQNPNNYQWFAGNRSVDAKMKKTFNELNDFGKKEEIALSSTGNPTLDFLERTAMDAQLTSDEIRAVTTKYRAGVSYPQSGFGNQLQMIAQMIAGGLKTRVYYVSMGGFDTHSNQRNNHDRLMATLAEGVSAFMKDLKTQGNDKRVLMMTFSEFGRRVAENASRGTDHGTAAPMFVFGSMVKGGVYGAHPSLKPADLDRGDLRYHTDFRSVYATLLEKWMKMESKAVLGAAFKQLPLLG